jgi:hypothetical protein
LNLGTEIQEGFLVVATGMNTWLHKKFKSVHLRNPKVGITRKIIVEELPNGLQEDRQADKDSINNAIDYSHSDCPRAPIYFPNRFDISLG